MAIFLALIGVILIWQVIRLAVILYDYSRDETESEKWPRYIRIKWMMAWNVSAKLLKAVGGGIFLSLLFYYTVKAFRSADTSGQVIVCTMLAFCYWIWEFNAISRRMLDELRVMREILDEASRNQKS